MIGKISFEGSENTHYTITDFFPLSKKNKFNKMWLLYTILKKIIPTCVCS